MKKMKVFGILILSFLVLTIIEAGAAKRVALVIGNGGYRSAPLDNPVDDATDISAVLKRMGFHVITKINADQKTMEDVLRIFKKKLSGAEIGLFYYAGHGMQIGGINYLIPVKNKIKEESDVKYFTVNANYVLSKMEDAGAPLNIVILDACRNNPLKRSFRDSSKGLAYMDAPDGTLIAYATKAGSVSEDGSGRNGTYTEALLRHIETPGLEIRMMFNRTGLDVEAKTGKAQKPWISNDSFPPYYLAGGTTTVASPSTSPDAGTGMMKILSEPMGAEIFIQGKARGRTPLEITDIAPGSYGVKAVSAGYHAEEKKIIVNQGRKAVVTFYLNVEATKAKLYVTTSPLDCKVKILNIVPAFYNGIELDTGRYKLEVSKSGYGTKIQWVDINAYQGIDFYVELEKQSAPPVLSTAQPGDTWKDPVTGMEFVWVPKGCYQMGSSSGGSNEKPVHEVCVDGFWMGQYEVTQGQWKKIMGHNPSKFQSGDTFPVESVSWNDAKNFVSKISQRSGNPFKLPTEAQWEYAARSGGRDQTYAGGHDIDKVAWDLSNSGSKTHRVGTKSPNGLGIHDMSGNVWEWCEDVYDQTAYSKHNRNNPLITSGASLRVRRGGSWSYFRGSLRAKGRSGLAAGHRYSYLGFRLVLFSVQ